MIQYMLCWKLHKLIPRSRISDICISEFNIQNPPSTIHDNKNTITLYDHTDIHFDSIISYSQQCSNLKIFLSGFFQKLSFYPSLEECRQLFCSEISLQETFSDDELVINIRCGELVSGHVSWYPILPVAFYEHIVEISGLRPVFVGQLDNVLYIEELKKAFPNARYIASKGALYDFQLVRSAKNIAISVSTFSWLAAWLSEAKNIFYPLAGFLNPALQKAYDQVELFTDFAATDDTRFRFFQMPFFHNEEISKLIRHHGSFHGKFYEVPPEIVANLKLAPFVKKKILPEYAQKKGKIDALWYLKEYPTAAREISEGYYESVTQHYEEIGWKRNYSPISKKYIPQNSILVSENCPAYQSSVAVEWSHGDTAETDASSLVNGFVSPDNFNHTQEQDDVWWYVDLMQIWDLSCIFIQNRVENFGVEERLFPFCIEISENGTDFIKIISYDTYTHKKDKKVICQFSESLLARFVRLKLTGKNRILSINQVKVYAKK
ncbi:discoidin domain-containing protein [Acetobacter persici]|uniref:discoidin domain-containing protein n=1 Tax=Acetobacter persici TaxID=1076596 RepID=UPI0039E7FB9D